MWTELDRGCDSGWRCDAHTARASTFVRMTHTNHELIFVSIYDAMHCGGVLVYDLYDVYESSCMTPGHGAVRADGRAARAALDAHRPQRHPHRSGHLPLPAARRRKARIAFDLGFHDYTLNTADSVTVVHFTTTVRKQPGVIPALTHTRHHARREPGVPEPAKRRVC